MIRCGLSIFGDARYRDAARPLFDSGAVEAVEWTVDIWDVPHAETSGILQNFGTAGNLIGHGVHYPVLAGQGAALQDEWLSKLAKDTKLPQYTGLSVHYGFATGWELMEGAPLPVPQCDAALETGRAALAKLAKLVSCPVGIENLALGFSKQDVLGQGPFIRELLASVNGYLLLDLHNIYCQSVNFDIDIVEMAKTYPLDLVKEIHVAGGSWSEHAAGPVRRDTHDGRAPRAIFDALPRIVPLCKNLEYVLFEKLPFSFENEKDAAGFRDDFLSMKQAVRDAA